MIHGGSPWGHATLAGSGRWDWFIGARNGGEWPWLDRGDGFDSWGLGYWLDGAMGLIYGGVRHWLEWGDDIDLWGCAMGARDWIGAMELICGGARSGWWDWFMGARHGGARHWLDWGDGVDSWEHAKWQSTIWLMNVNDNTMYPHVWRWGKCAECVWLRAW